MFQKIHGIRTRRQNIHIKDKVNEYKQFTTGMSGADLGLIFKGFEKITAESGSI